MLQKRASKALSNIIFYANEQPIDQEQDSSYTSVKFALVADPD